MANCKHGNDIDQCGFCRVERHDQLHRNWSGEIATGLKGKGVEPLGLREAGQISIDREDRVHDILALQEYIANSFKTDNDESNDSD